MQRVFTICYIYTVYPGLQHPEVLPELSHTQPYGSNSIDS